MVRWKTRAKNHVTFIPLYTNIYLLNKFAIRYVIATKPTYFEIGATNAVEIYTWNGKLLIHNPKAFHNFRMCSLEKQQEIEIDFTFNQNKVDGPFKRIPQKGFLFNKKTNAE